MGFIQRFMSGVKGFIAAYNANALLPMEGAEWDDYGYRLMRYQLSEMYYSNVVYKQLGLLSATAAQRKIDNKLYKRVRGIYNPVNRLVEGYVSKVYGGSVDYDNLDSGALPILNADDTLRQSIRRVLKWSRFDQTKSLYVRNGAKLGDVFWKLVDDTASERIRMELLPASYVKEIETDGNGRIEKILIEYQRDDETTDAFRPNNTQADYEKYYTYSEVITPDYFATYRDGEPYAFVNDSEGNKLAKWANPYGFVPVAHVQHIDQGLGWGASAYHMALDKIDELNDQASLLNDAVRKSVDIAWLFVNINKPDEKQSVANDNRDDMKALYVQAPADKQVDVKALVPNLDITATISNIEHLRDELERDMPELSMHHLRDSAQQTAPGIKSAYNDAIGRYREAQGNYDNGLVQALTMGIAMGGVRGYQDFRGYGADDYLRDNIEFSINARPIIDDELSKGERIQYFIQSSAPNKAIWDEMGVAEETIAEWQSEIDANKQQMMDMMQGAPPSDGTQPPNDQTAPDNQQSGNNANPNQP